MTKARNFDHSSRVPRHNESGFEAGRSARLGRAGLEIDQRITTDDATRNTLILQAHKAAARRFSGECITGFGALA